MDELALPLSALAGRRSEAKRAGERYYFTGRPCCRGHISKRSTVNWVCRECAREDRRLCRSNMSGEDNEAQRAYDRLYWAVRRKPRQLAAKQAALRSVEWE